VPDGDPAFSQRFDVQLAAGPAQIIEANNLSGGDIIEKTVSERASGEPAYARDEDFHGMALLRATGFYRRKGREVSRNFIGRKCFDIHFDETDKRTAVVRSLPAAAVDDHTNAGNLSSMSPDDVHGFLDTSAAGDDVLGDNKPLVRPDLKTAPQGEPSGFFFDEDVPFAEGAPNLLANDDSAEGRRNDYIAFNAPQFIRQSPANFSGDVGVLKEQCALEELPAVEARSQNEMAVEQRAGFAKKREQILAH